MLDPLKLAEDLEDELADAERADPYRLSTNASEMRLLAAALRLAEASLAWEDAEEQTADQMIALGLRFDAYRRAKGDSHA